MKKAMIIFAGIVVFLNLLNWWHLGQALDSGYKGYTGENPELLSVAVNSLLGIRGLYLHEVYEDAKIQIVEKDEYGRVLFAYGENSHISTFNFLIMQKSDEKYAYYYPHYNFISSEGYGLDRQIFDAYIDSKFSEDDVMKLKEKNDWGKPMEDSKSIKVQISRRSNQASIQIPEESFEKLLQLIASQSGYQGTDRLYKYQAFFKEDTYGRTLYYVRGIGRANPSTVYFDVVMIFNPDGSYDESTCVMELSDNFQYQEELRGFLQRNHWDELV